jgi:hypothetical protein
MGSFPGPLAMYVGSSRRLGKAGDRLPHGPFQVGYGLLRIPDRPVEVQLNAFKGLPAVDQGEKIHQTGLISGTGSGHALLGLRDQGGPIDSLGFGRHAGPLVSSLHLIVNPVCEIPLQGFLPHHTRLLFADISSVVCALVPSDLPAR